MILEGIFTRFFFRNKSEGFKLSLYAILILLLLLAQNLHERNTYFHLKRIGNSMMRESFIASILGLPIFHQRNLIQILKIINPSQTAFMNMNKDNLAFLKLLIILYVMFYNERDGFMPNYIFYNFI
ncbi:hypothetical protein ACJX0J_010398, partial [Zea mays]